MKLHALNAPNGPALCGVGNGRKLGYVRGTPINDLATVDFTKLVTCKACLRRVRKRFPAWFDVAQLRLVRR
jgi:hypothetical protein